MLFATNHVKCNEFSINQGTWKAMTLLSCSPWAWDCFQNSWERTQCRRIPRIPDFSLWPGIINKMSQLWWLRTLAIFQLLTWISPRYYHYQLLHTEYVYYILSMSFMCVAFAFLKHSDRNSLLIFNLDTFFHLLP